MEQSLYLSDREWTMLDMHAHLAADQEADLNYRKENGIFTCFSAGTPGECENLLRWKNSGENGFCPTFGLHPWYADQYTPEDMMPYLKQAAVIGEIGMDGIWCEVPHDIQRRIFCRQLEYAAESGKSVVLHTKDMESEIYDCIRDFPNPILVHWYSGPMDVFEKFLEKGCYFTIGPEMAETENGREMIDRIPIQRLFVETDGLDAVAWAKGRETAEFREIGETLQKSARLISQMKQLSFGMDRMRDNFLSFVNRKI